MTEGLGVQDDQGYLVFSSFSLDHPVHPGPLDGNAVNVPIGHNVHLQLSAVSFCNAHYCNKVTLWTPPLLRGRGRQTSFPPDHLPRLVPLACLFLLVLRAEREGQL